jgi:hypothetical protein
MLLAAILIELIGIATTSTGIGMELMHSGEIYLVVITTGSCMVALGGVLFGKFFKTRK